jgi:predicted Rossmann fold nucleotide-binding protein DprA/Smf involved in DNA uptake
LVLIQSPLRGGALISAQLALDSGVDCWVYRPDNVKETGERWAGNRKILEEFPDMGWHSMEELLAHLGKPMKAVAPNQLETELTDELLPIWNCIIEKGGAQVSDIAQACQVPLAMTARRLFILELKGLVQRIPGGWYVPRNLG